VALVTRDPLLYGELAPALRERRIPTLSLLPGQRIPDRVAIVLTSPLEESRIVHPHVVAVAPEGERTALWAEVAGALTADDRSELVIGIDPGPRPGFAVLAGRQPLVEGVLDSPEAAGRLASQVRHRFPDRPVRFRVGRGDRIARDRIVAALLPLRRRVELVDEEGTTPRGVRHRRDPLAARAIARTEGRPVHAVPPLTTTRGEVQDLQRKSREGSGGRFTIPRQLAEKVLRGELTLSEAIDGGGDRPSRVGRGPRTGPREPS